MAVSAQRTDPALWERIKREILQGDQGGDPGEWSARKAQIAVQEYRRRGGGYAGPSRGDSGLPQWSQSHSGQRQQGSRDYPSRDDLMVQARQRAIPGRSHMTKEELRRALRTYS